MYDARKRLTCVESACEYSKVGCGWERFSARLHSSLTLRLREAASAPPTPYKLISQPQLKTVDDLKGKKIGIDRIGGSSYYATRRMLQKLGVRPESVEFIQVAGGGAQRVAAFRSGMISAVVSTIE